MNWFQEIVCPLGAISPVEISVGAALMHSKVFYARAKDECWLWTGSHNLTAMQHKASTAKLLCCFMAVWTNSRLFMRCGT